jgi:hypothetical protein
MAKRGNENGQLTKEENERLESADGGGDASGVFSRAPDEVLASRRTYKSARRPPSSASLGLTVPNANGYGDGDAPVKANPFAKVDLTKGISTPSFAFGVKSTATTTASAPAPAAGVTGFSFGQKAAPAPVTAATPSVPFSFGQSLSSSSAAAPTPASTSATPSFSFGKAPSSSAVSSSSSSSGAAGTGGNKEAAKLCAKANRNFRDTVLGMPSSVTDLSIAAEKYRRFAIHQMDKAQKSSTTTGTTGSSTSGSSTGAGPSAPAAPAAPAPSFGGFAATSKSPAASGGSSSFAFGGNSRSAAPPPVPGADTTTETADGDAAAPEDPADGIQAAVDPNWDDVEDFEPIMAYHQKDTKDKDSAFAKFAQGKMRVQRSKDSASHRMLMRDKTGLKVLLNMKVSAAMELKWKEIGKRRNVDFGEITFYGTNKEERGYELIRLLTPVSAGEPLYHQLKALC